MNYEALARAATDHAVDFSISDNTTNLHARISAFATALAEWHGFNRFDAFRETARLALADVAIEALSMLRDLHHTQWDFRESLMRRIAIFAPPSVIVEPLREYADASLVRDAGINLELLVVTCHELAQRLFTQSIHDVVMSRLEGK